MWCGCWGNMEVPSTRPAETPGTLKSIHRVQQCRAPAQACWLRPPVQCTALPANISTENATENRTTRHQNDTCAVVGVLTLACMLCKLHCDDGNAAVQVANATIPQYHVAKERVLICSGGEEEKGEGEERGGGVVGAGTACSNTRCHTLLLRSAEHHDGPMQELPSSLPTVLSTTRLYNMSIVG